MRKDRAPNELRHTVITPDYLKDPEGSVLIEMGATKVLCTATVSDKIPNFLKGTGEGWITAEYALLPRSTPQRNIREGRGGRLDTRALEISRMIGRSLRGCVDLGKLGENTIIIDCDVLQADGGTRTASITGGFCALWKAVQFMLSQKIIEVNPIRFFLAGVSVGIVEGTILLDLSYNEDTRASVDLNIVMTEDGNIVEIQGTGEKEVFSLTNLFQMVEIAKEGISQLVNIQKSALRD